MALIPVLLNCNAGAVESDPNIRDRVAEAFAHAGAEADVELVEGGKCEVRTRAIAERGDALVVVGGGDGTISAAAAALAGTRTALGILPLGTLNHFARDLGIPTVIEEAIDLIARRTEHHVDVGLMNDRIFINNSAIGLYPLMLVNRDLQRMKLGRSKRLAMIVASLRTLARFNHQRLTLVVDDQKARVDTPLLFVGNNDYRIDIRAPGQRESIEQGELCVYVMRKKTRTGFMAATVRALFNRARRDDMVKIEHVQRLQVSARHRSLAVSLDGEVVRALPPLDYSIRKKALRVIAP
ncbi:MAG: diacylglycerol/lipid kinase family protein [Sphingomicrobium sp.]